MKKLLLFFFIGISIIQLNAQNKSFITYYQLSNYLHSSPGAFKYGLYGFENPAITSYLHDNDFLFMANDKSGNLNNFDDWGLFTGSPFGGFGLLTHKENGNQVVDYRYNFAFGSKTIAFGVGYGWVGGSKSYFQRSNTYHFGGLYRPNEYLSIGAHITGAIDNEDKEYVSEIAIRPFKNYPLALFADFSFFNNNNLKDGHWSGGISWEIVDGIRVNGRYFDNKAINLGVDLSLGSIGFGAIGSNISEKNNTKMNTTYALRLGADDRTIIGEMIDNIVPAKIWYRLDLSGVIKYQKGGFFDSNPKTLLSILNQIDIATKDKMIEGILINATTASSNRTIMWEIREKLLEFKKAGKKIYIYIERAGLDDYHFASIADKIYMEPLGNLSLEGYALGRSFYKSMLEKVGIGFDELRFFKYKSAYESFANDKMSEGDREQRQKLIDDFYKIVKKDIINSRNISETDFENLVNGQIGYRTKECIDKKLVDAEGRWLDAEKTLKDNDKNIAAIIDIRFINSRPQPFDDKWGTGEDKIAIIYAIGECAMESGIKARTLVNDIKRAAEDNSIKAIVLRVDSPGGDALASDYIAQIVRQFKGKKPIIVSQGAVAASGGYWLSMDADKIVSTPMTITGSIGVIGGLFYDKGLKEKLGITTDLVKVGKYSDLGNSFQLPFIGIGLPNRPYNEDERKQMENMILKFYDDFTEMVAKGRNMNIDDVKKVAQGRVWTGETAKELKLVDELGGLYKAINLAKKSAGINEDKQIRIIEYPKINPFDFNSFFEMLTGINLKSLNKIDSKLNNLLFMMKNNGQPLHMLPMDYMELVPDFNY